jgi:SAM-dependent methyltransferase
MNLVTPCLVCTSLRTEQFLLRPSVVVHQNLVIDGPLRARQLRRGVLRLVCCHDCGFVFNAAFDPTLVEYGSAYDNTQTCSPLFQTYTEELADYLVREKGIRAARIVEVGCGAGGFLRRLVEYPGSANRGWGFDPSYTGLETDADGRLQFCRRYYDEQSADVPADVVVCRHVIEHVPDPVGLLRTVRRALDRSRGARLFFETPCVEWILANQVVWDFFYEHCSYFTRASLRTAFELAGFGVLEVRHVFGGQYLWLEAVLDPAVPRQGPSAGPVPELAAAFGVAEPRKVTGWWQRIAELSSRGRVAVWGAGAKGVTFTNLVDPDRERFACVVDVNPRKQGRYLPGTGHPIIGHPLLHRHGVQTALLLNPNYRAEIVALLAEEDLAIDVLDLMALEGEDARNEASSSVESRKPSEAA